MRKNIIGKSFAVISIITLLFTLFQSTIFAIDSADKSIVSDITSLSFVNFSIASDTTSGTTQNGLISYSSSAFDSTLNKNVVQYSSSAFAENYGVAAV